MNRWKNWALTHKQNHAFDYWLLALLLTFTVMLLSACGSSVPSEDTQGYLKTVTTSTRLSMETRTYLATHEDEALEAGRDLCKIGRKEGPKGMDRVINEADYSIRADVRVLAYAALGHLCPDVGE